MTLPTRIYPWLTGATLALVMGAAPSEAVPPTTRSNTPTGPAAVPETPAASTGAGSISQAAFPVRAAAVPSQDAAPARPPGPLYTRVPEVISGRPPASSRATESARPSELPPTFRTREGVPGLQSTVASRPAASPERAPEPLSSRVPDSLTNPNREPFGGPAAPGRPADPLPSGSLDALPSQAPRSGPSALRERELVPREIRRTPEGKQALMEAKAFQEARRLRLAQNRIYYTTFNGGSPYEKLVALTFDDGPDPKSTLKVLAALRRAKVPATFFVIGRKVDRYPEIVRQTAAEGHDLGNHTYHHYDLSRLDDAGVRFEIERTSQSIARVVGGPTRWFRAPGCRYNDQMLAMLTDLNMIRVDTTNNSGDWNKKNSLAIIRRTLDRLAPGDVILCHDRLPLTVQALPELIRQVRERGFRFVPLAELALRAQLTGYFPPFQPRNQGIVIEEPRRKMQRARAKRRMRSPVNVSLPTPTPVSNVSERRSSPKLAENVTLPTPTTLTPSASNGVTKPVRVYPKARQ